MRCRRLTSLRSFVQTFKRSNVRWRRYFRWRRSSFVVRWSLLESSFDLSGDFEVVVAAAAVVVVGGKYIHCCCCMERFREVELDAMVR